MKSLFLAFLLLTAGIAVQGQTKSNNQKPLRFLLGAALEFGGDNLAEVYFTDGSTQTMNAGQGGTLLPADSYV